METQELISSLIHHLGHHALVPNPSETWLDRASITLRVRATFENGQSIAVDVSDRESIVKIRTLWQKNLKSVFAKTSEYKDLLNLESGQRYTLLVDSEMGLGVVAVQMTLEAIVVGRFAQYDNCIELIYKRKGTRTARSIQFYGKKSFAIFEGWINVDTNPFGPEANEGPVTVRRSKYLSFDDRYMTDAIASTSVNPLFEKLFPFQRQERSLS